MVLYLTISWLRYLLLHYGWGSRCGLVSNAGAGVDVIGRSPVWNRIAVVSLMRGEGHAILEAQTEKEVKHTRNDTADLRKWRRTLTFSYKQCTLECHENVLCLQYMQHVTTTGEQGVE